MNLTNFKEKLTAINEQIYFDKNDNLREKPIDPTKLDKLIYEAKALLADADEEDTYYFNGVLGNIYRIKGQPKQAISYLTACVEYAVNKKSPSMEIVALIRLGEAFKYNDAHDLALEKFHRALEICEAEHLNKYADFALQHKGKCLMELERLKEAEACFTKALELRNIKGDTRLIDSTQQALDLVKEKMQAD